MPTKRLQVRVNGSKYGSGIPPRRAFCGRPPTVGYIGVCDQEEGVIEYFCRQRTCSSVRGSAASAMRTHSPGHKCTACGLFLNKVLFVSARAVEGVHDCQRLLQRSLFASGEHCSCGQRADLFVGERLPSLRDQPSLPLLEGHSHSAGSGQAVAQMRGRIVMYSLRW